MNALERAKPEMPRGTTDGDGRKRWWRRKGPARRVVRFLLLTLLLCAAVAVAGFLHFAETVAALETPRDPQADAIVVLTGGYQRIDHAMDLLKAGAGRRLLISGANPTTSGNQLRKLTQSSSSLFECCVDIGYDAMDTIGNANETAHWIEGHGFERVLVVTNNYHMPRSLLELRRSDRRTEFIAYPVVNSDLKAGNWLTQPGVLRTMLAEYLKYSVVRLRELAGRRTWSGLRGDLGGT